MDPILYKWIRCKFFRRSESVNTCPSTLHTSTEKACIQKVNKPAKIVEILVDGWECQAVCIEAFLEYVVENCLPTKPSQVNFNDVSFHAHTMP